MNRRRMAIGAMLLIAAVAFAGGGPENGSEETTLTIWDFKYGEDGWGSVFREINTAFMEANPNIIVEHVAQPEGQYYELIRATLASRSGPDIGIFHPTGQAWELADGLVRLDDYVEPWRDDLTEDSWAAVIPFREEERGIRLVPVTVQGFGWYYNRAVLEAAGVDPQGAITTAEGFREALVAVRDAGYRPIVWGNVPGYHTNWLLRSHIGSMIGQRGVEGFADASTVFADQRISTVVEYFVDLRSDGLLDDQGAATPLWMDALDQFKAGDGAFFFGLLSDIAHWRDFGDALGASDVGFFPVVNLPGAASPDSLISLGAGLGYGVMEYSKHIDEAMSYLEYLSSAESAALLVEQIGVISPNKNVSVPGGGDALTAVLSHLAGNVVTDYGTYLPGAVMDTQVALDELLFNAQEISVEEYLSTLDREHDLIR